MSEILSVLIADDHPVFRKGLQDIIDEDARFRVVGAAEDGEKVLQYLEQFLPDILVLDIDMPNLGGLDVARIVQKRNIATHIVVLTMYKDESIFNKAMDLGVRGYVLKDNAVTDILNSLKTVAEGKYYITPSIGDFLLRRTGRTATTGAKGLGLLTPAERRVLGFIAEHMTSKQIADKLCISPKTVEHHRENIVKKLDLHGSHALLKFALDHRADL